MPSERTRLARSSQKTLIELSLMPVARRWPVSLRAVQLTCLFEFSKLIEPIDGSYFSLSCACWRISE